MNDPSFSATPERSGSPEETLPGAVLDCRSKDSRQRVKEEHLARRRYQKGSLLLRGKREKVWVGRWLEDEVRPDGTIHRRHRSEVLGTVKDHPTKRLALRLLEGRLAEVNSAAYRPRHVITFREFAERWTRDILPAHKPSSRSSERAHLKKYLLPAFGGSPLSQIDTMSLQRFISGLKVAPKTVRNIVATLRTMWGTAKAWGFVSHDPFGGLRFPSRALTHRPCFTAEQSREIIRLATEPWKTMFWIVAETGMRGGELCGLFVEDVNLKNGLLHVRRSAWRGKLQTPKTENALRHFPISPNLAEHIREHLEKTKKSAGLLFSTRAGKPFDNHNLVTWQLKPLLEKIGFTEEQRKKMGFHAFRHGNASVLDGIGAPIKVRMDRLGHADSETTFGYTHAVSEDHRRVAAELGRVFDPTLPHVPATARIETRNDSLGLGA